MRQRSKSKSDFQTKVIKRQSEQIEDLKKQIDNLEISVEEKDKIINSIDSLRQELSDTITDLKNKGDEYDVLIADLMQMREVFNKEVFKGRWRLVKFLIR